MVVVARAVHHAHQRGMLHRDLKPSNVLVDSQGTRLVDRLRPGEAAGRPAMARFTETGQVLGTPKYMAPEQAAGRKDLTRRGRRVQPGRDPLRAADGPAAVHGRQWLDAAAPGPRIGAAAAVVDPAGVGSRSGNGRAQVPGKGAGPALSVGRRWPDDLRRWLRGEPIDARVVGRMEKSWLWARRNPAIAIAGGVAVAASVAVAVACSFAALQAQARAKAERERREIADSAHDRLARASRLTGCGHSKRGLTQTA